jgi:hypothetical protein
MPDMLFPKGSSLVVTTAAAGNPESCLWAAGKKTALKIFAWRMRPPVTICVLTYGDYPDLAEQPVESIRNHCERSRYRLLGGANGAGAKTLEYLRPLESEQVIGTSIVNAENITSPR